MGGLRVAVRALRRADPPLPEAHRRQALPLQRVRQVLRPVGPPRPAHEAPHAQGRQVSSPCLRDLAPGPACRDPARIVDMCPPRRPGSRRNRAGRALTGPRWYSAWVTSEDLTSAATERPQDLARTSSGPRQRACLWVCGRRVLEVSGGRLVREAAQRCSQVRDKLAVTSTRHCAALRGAASR